MKKIAIIIILFFILTEMLCIGFTIRSIHFPLKYQNLIKKYSTENNLEPELVASVINVESGYNCNAKSSAGAIGLMQILPSTATYICNLKGIDYLIANELFQPEINIKIGCAYLRYLINKFEDISTSLASYNAGETVVRTWLQNLIYSTDKKTLNSIPYKETKNYIKKINFNYKIYNKYKF